MSLRCLTLHLCAVWALGLGACSDEFLIADEDAGADATPDGSADVVDMDAGADAASLDAASLDAASLDANVPDTLPDALAVDVGPSGCALPWLYYVVQSDVEATYVARYSIGATGPVRCENLTAGGAIAENASSALALTQEQMILAADDQLQLLNLTTDRIEWTLPVTLPFQPQNHIALFYLGSSDFGVGWDREAPSLGGVSVRRVSDGTSRAELDVRWLDATAAPGRRGEVWMVGRAEGGERVLQRYSTSSEVAVDEILLSAERISSAGERLYIDAGNSYRIYELLKGEPIFIDTVVLPSAECRLVDVIGDPSRDAAFVGCGEDGQIRNVRVHLRASDAYELIPDAVTFDESVFSLSLFEGP